MLPPNAQPNMKRIPRDARIRIGQVWVPVARLPETLARFTRMVSCLTDFDDHPYCFRGSATSLRWGEQHLMFCCNHQIADFDPNKVVVPLDKDGRMMVSGTSCIRLMTNADNDGEEMLDVCAMGFNSVDFPEVNLGRSFFNLRAGDVWSGDRDTTFLVFWISNESSCIGVRRRKICVEPRQSQDDRDNRYIYRPECRKVRAQGQIA